MKVRAGSYTVEASFLLPILMVIAVLGIVMGMYYHDRQTLSALSQYYLKAAYHMIDEPVSVTGQMEIKRLEAQGLFRANGFAKQVSPAEVEDAFRRDAEKGLLITEIKSVRVQITGESADISYEAESRIGLFGGFAELLGLSGHFAEGIHKSRPLSPEEFVRICRGIIWRKE